MNNPLQDFVCFVGERDGINDKSRLAKEAAKHFGLTKDGAPYYCNDFAVRFSSSAKTTFSNTITALSKLQKFDDRPFVGKRHLERPLIA